MNRILLLSALLSAGCTTYQPHDYFATADQFAADRQRETIHLSSISYADAYVQVAEVLLDLDCTLAVSNQELGVISASGALKILPSSPLDIGPRYWRSCAGHRVTVTVNESADESVLIRASFQPANEQADTAFRSLLRKSLTLENTGGD